MIIIQDKNNKIRNFKQMNMKILHTFPGHNELSAACNIQTAERALTQRADVTPSSGRQADTRRRLPYQ